MNNTGASPPNPPADPVRPPEAVEQTALDWARDTGEADRVIDDLDAYLRRRRRRRASVAATSVVLVLLGVVSWPVWRTKMELPVSPVAVNAVVLRPETRTLADGSVVELNAGAEIEVDFAGPLRRVALRKGEAHFQVTKDAQRPFVVAAGGVEVRAVGTAFSVELGTKAIEVLVTEGRVAVEKPAQPSVASSDAVAPVAASRATFGVGKRIVVELIPEIATATPEPQVTTVSPAELDEHLAWRVPRLEFSGTLLAHALPMFNQHGRVRLTLAEPALGRLQLSGVLRADDTESLLRLLEGEFDLKAERRGDAIVLRRR
jgi:transmembrane sensor